MSNTSPLKWQSPLDYCATHELGDAWVLLYSGMRNQGSGGHSYLATHPTQIYDSTTFADSAHSPETFYGYLGYELCHALEDIPVTAASPIALPPQWLIQPQQLIEWDHTARHCHGQEHATKELAAPSDTPPKVTSLHSNMSKADYLDCVERTLEHVRNGAFYQANITRKFHGECEEEIDAFALFQSLTTISPSAFSAYIQMGETAILSSSPEGFVSCDVNGHITTRPIKGTARRGTTVEEDEIIKQQLLSSEKDRAENLMIVDLMRNDLARCTQAGSVRVSALHELHSFATIHQLISTIEAQRAEGKNSWDLVRAAFPAGSMTGAPKIAAMRWCAEQEKLQRGVYSGAIGWINPKACDLSVVIRTIIVQGKRFEFQVGGGIVADSDPMAEWEETLVKATAIAKALGICTESLRAL